MNILVIDDSPLCRELVGAVLENQGYSVRKACNGVDALAAVATRKPDLVILDAKMPKLDGYDFLTRLRQSERGQKVPVILLMGVDDRSEILRVSRGGVSECILKSQFNLNELLRRVRKYLPAEALAMGDSVLYGEFEAPTPVAASDGGVELQRFPQR